MISSREMIEQTGVSKTTLYRWIANGEVKATRKRGQWWFKKGAVEKVRKTIKDRERDMTLCPCGAPRDPLPSYKGNLCAECRRAYNSAWMRLKKFGLTPADYDRMLAEQDGVCAICGQPEVETRNGRVKALAVDHCHETGRVRGLLCSLCNRSLARLETPGWTAKAKRYLKTHKI